MRAVSLEGTGRLVAPLALALAQLARPPATAQEALGDLGAIGRLTAAEARSARPLDFSGTVLYRDTDWGLLFVGQGSDAVFVDPLGLPEAPALALGTQVRVRGRSAWLRDGVAVAASAVVPVALAALPDGATPSADRLALAAPAQWVAIEGVVQRRSWEPSRGELQVRVAGQPVVVHVPAPPPAELRRLVDARVRLRGVLERGPASGRHPRLFVPAWSELTVLAPAPPVEALPTITVREALAGAPRAEHRVRLRPRVVGRGSHGRFVMEDATGRIEAALERPEFVQQGSLLDLQGFLSGSGRRVALVEAGWQLLSSPAAPSSRSEGRLPLIETAAAVRSLARAEAERGYPVRLEGVVTYVDPGDHHLFVEDQSAGLYVHKPVGDIGVRPGWRVRVEGRSGPGNLAPIVLDPRITPLGRAPLPASRPVGAARFLTGRDDCRRVQIVGILRSTNRNGDRVGLVLEADGLRLEARLPLAPPELEPDSLIDATVRLEGVCSTEANWRGQLMRTTLFVGQPRDVVPLEPAPSPPALSLTSLSDVLRAGGAVRWGHRVRVSATVLHLGLDRRLALHDGRSSLSALLQRALAASPGDEVEVLGFPAPGPAGPVLEDAIARIVAHRPPPEPRLLSAAALSNAEGELVAVRARLQDLAAADSPLALALQDGETFFEARVETEREVAPYRRDSLLELVGIPTLHSTGPQSERLVLLVRSPADVRVIEGPRFWTPRRASWTLAALLGVLLLAFAWGVTLRRQVAAKTRELRERLEHESQVEAQVRSRLEQTVEERSRQLAELQSKLLHEERMAALGRLTTTVSHELRNPLATIRGSLFLLSEGLKEPSPRVQRALERAERSIRRSDQIIDELLDYSRARRLERTTTEIDVWLARALADIAVPPGVELTRELSSGLTLEIDAPRLLRCIINLVTNAAEAIVGPSPPGSRSGSRIDVSTRAAGGRLELRVIDDGPGIPSEIQQRVFEPFFSTKSFGVGLGLPLVRQIVEQHGGGVELASRPGSTCFTLWLPVAPPADGPPGNP